ncbi:MAG: hypothetical protein IJH34_16880 [Romboutsia sp.]|nr:hypothetical protein [Romboutsia sp.]
MANYANQKTVWINNITTIYSDEKSGDLFLHSVKWKYIQAAKKILTDSGFTVWLYFLKWSGIRDKTTGKPTSKDFSPAQVHEEFGISENGARNGFTDLLNKGYLKKRDDKINVYDFTPVSTTEVVV